MIKMTSKLSIFTRYYLVALGILCGITALGMMGWTWERELSTVEIAWVLGFFSTAVSILLLAIHRRRDSLQNQFQK